MLGTLNGPWLLCAAVLLLGVALWRTPRLPRWELWLLIAISACAAVARLSFGVWGPLHVNGQGPLWIRGALDPDALGSYGPGYFELFSWVARFGTTPDRAIFAANAILSALSPALLYAVARLLGVARGGALAAAVVLAADAVTIRTAASELYIWPQIALVLAVQVSLGIFARARLRGDRLAAASALGAASLLAAAVARIHLLGALPLALSPLVVLGAARPERWRDRVLLTIESGAAIGAAILLSTGAAIVRAWSESPVTGQSAFSRFHLQDAGLLLLLLVGLWLMRRWARPPWLPLMGVGSLLLLSIVQTSFRLHPFQELFYERLCWPGLLLGAAPFLPRRMQGWRWSLGVALVVAAALQISALPYLGGRTTEQDEHAFLQEVLPSMPANCKLAAVSRADKRVWAIPSYLIPSRSVQEIEGPTSLRDAIADAECIVYVRSSLCSSAEGRPLCASAEHEVPLERVARRMFPAAPSYLALPYDRSEVEVVVFRAVGRAVATMRAPGGVSDGVAITPEFAQSLFDRVQALREPDGCNLTAFDTSRFRITIGLQAPNGAQHAFDLATARLGSGGRSAGGWALAVPPELDRDCGSTIAAIERVLGATAAPRRKVEVSFLRTTYDFLAALAVILVLGTLMVLYREATLRPPSAYALLALVLVSGAALALRLSLSPRTFLHEYYHIAETVPGYLTGEIAPLYGKTGPALFRLVGAVLGLGENVQVIFLTNAVISALAIPALALLDLALLGSWPHALCAAVFLCVLPLHLRFSAAEDLFVQAVTVGLWALGLFALYLRTGRLVDALLAGLALALAMQTRPEMLIFPGVLVTLVLLVQPRSWRVLFAWRTLLALLLLAALLIPRFIELGKVLHQGSPTSDLPDLRRYLSKLVLFQPEVTPAIFWPLLLAGLAWGAWYRSGLVLWASLVFVGYTLSALTLFDNPPYNLRSQILPTSFAMLIAAGAAPVWMALWGARRRPALVLGAGVLAVFALFVVASSRPFVTELHDQQLEFSFLERTVPQLPERATLLAAVDVGGRNLNAFPQFLLASAQKTYELIDVRRAANGEAAWPEPGEDLIYYQGMFCFFAFDEDEPPDPMTAPCQAVHARYTLEPMFVETLDTKGYSYLRYAPGPYHIGFFRLTALKRAER